MLWLVAASAAFAATPDGALAVFALLLGLAFLDAVRRVRVSPPLVPGQGVPVHTMGAPGTARPRPSRLLLSTFRC